MFDLESDHAELLEKIEDLITRKHYAELRDLLLPMEAADIAALCGDLDERVPLMFRLLPKELAAEVFVELDSDEQEVLIQRTILICVLSSKPQSVRTCRSLTWNALSKTQWVRTRRTLRR